MFLKSLNNKSLINDATVFKKTSVQTKQKNQVKSKINKVLRNNKQKWIKMIVAEIDSGRHILIRVLERFKESEYWKMNPNTTQIQKKQRNSKRSKKENTKYTEARQKLTTMFMKGLPWNLGPNTPIPLDWKIQLGSSDFKMGKNPSIKRFLYQLAYCFQTKSMACGSNDGIKTYLTHLIVSSLKDKIPESHLSCCLDVLKLYFQLSRRNTLHLIDQEFLC